MPKGGGIRRITTLLMNFLSRKSKKTPAKSKAGSMQAAMLQET
jgi:hypothetical protein